MARSRRIKLVWGSTARYPEYRSLGLWLIDARAADANVRGVAVNVRALLWWGLLAMAAVYAAGTMQWYALQHRRAHCSITRRDALLLPLRWAEIREKTGRDLIAQGLEALESGHWGEAQMLLRAGLSRAPHETAARVGLADLYVLGGRRPQALALLTEDLAHGYPGRQYLANLFRFANEGEDFGTVLAVCDRFRAGVPSEDRTWLRTEESRALLGARRSREVVALVDAEGEQAGSDLREARVLARLDLGRCGDALAELDAWRARPGANRVQIMRLRAQALRQAGRSEEMEATLKALWDFAPDEPRLRVFGMVQEILAGREPMAAAELDDFLWHFGGNAQALAYAAAELSEAGALKLVERCATEAELHGFPARTFLQMLADTQIVRADWAGAARTVGRLALQSDQANPIDRYYLLWAQRLIAATAPDEGLRVALLEVLQARPVPIRLVRRTVEAMIAAGRLETANGACEIGLRLFPASDSLRQLGERVRTLVAAQTPAPPAPRAIREALPDEADFFRQVETLATAEKWEQAADLVRKGRALKPAWLARREAAVLDWAMRLAIKNDDVPELISAARLYLNGSHVRADRVLALAADMHKIGATGPAKLLLVEVLRCLPNYSPARALQAQWTPDAAAKS